MCKNKKAQSTLEYATVVIVSTMVIVIAGPMVIRSVNAMFKTMGDSQQESVNDPISYAEPDLDLPEKTCDWGAPHFAPCDANICNGVEKNCAPGEHYQIQKDIGGDPSCIKCLGCEKTDYCCSERPGGCETCDTEGDRQYFTSCVGWENNIQITKEEESFCREDASCTFDCVGKNDLGPEYLFCIDDDLNVPERLMDIKLREACSNYNTQNDDWCEYTCAPGYQMVTSTKEGEQNLECIRDNCIEFNYNNFISSRLGFIEDCRQGLNTPCTDMYSDAEFCKGQLCPQYYHCSYDTKPDRWGRNRTFPCPDTRYNDTPWGQSEFLPRACLACIFTTTGRDPNYPSTSDLYFNRDSETSQCPSQKTDDWNSCGTYSFDGGDDGRSIFTNQGGKAIQESCDESIGNECVCRPDKTSQCFCRSHEPDFSCEHDFDAAQCLLQCSTRRLITTGGYEKFSGGRSSFTKPGVYLYGPDNKGQQPAVVWPIPEDLKNAEGYVLKADIKSRAEGETVAKGANEAIHLVLMETPVHEHASLQYFIAGLRLKFNPGFYAHNGDPDLPRAKYGLPSPNVSDQAPEADTFYRIEIHVNGDESTIKAISLNNETFEEEGVIGSTSLPFLRNDYDYFGIAIHENAGVATNVKICTSEIPCISLGITAGKYTGSLGGLAGANAKCQAEFGEGSRFATKEELENLCEEIDQCENIIPAGVRTWVHLPAVANDWYDNRQKNCGKLDGANQSWKIPTCGRGFHSGTTFTSGGYSSNKKCCADKYSLPCINDSCNFN